MNKERLKSHVEWLRGDHEHCNPFLVEDIENLLADNERLRVQREAMEKYLAGEPSNPPRTGIKKRKLSDV